MPTEKENRESQNSNTQAQALLAAGIYRMLLP